MSWTSQVNKHNRLRNARRKARAQKPPKKKKGGGKKKKWILWPIIYWK